MEQPKESYDDHEEDMISDEESFTTADASATNTTTDVANEKLLAKKETKAVFHLRMLVLAVLVIAGVGVSVGVYFLTINAEKAEAEAEFRGSAEKVLQAFDNVVGEKVAALGTFGVSMTAYALAQGDTWPFVAMNAFQERARTARTLSKSLSVTVCPLVEDEDRAEYGNFTVANRDWLDSGREFQEYLGLNEFLIPPGINTSVPYPLYPDVLGVDQSFQLVPEDTYASYSPFWQSSPLVPFQGTNLNTLTHFRFRTGVKTVLDTKDVMIGQFDRTIPGDMRSDDQQTAYVATILALNERNRSATYEGEPMSIMYVPIFDTIEVDRRVTAVMIVLVSWASYFENILPSTTKGVVVVLENGCDDPHTFEIDSGDVRSIGQGNLHETEFDHLAITSKFDATQVINDGSRQGLGLSQNGCNLEINVYPSTTFFEGQSSNDPIYYAGAVGVVFAFTVLMFLLYDRLVERRQKLILHTATQSTAIVSSMFPENVRERLIVAQSKPMSSKKRLKSYLNSGDSVLEDTQPIADVFPFATVMFADISGFTAWSSTRDPSQVFVLLQAVYQSMDALATLYKVFKVETIGDSYVAVTGLPNPQENHHTIMARFAHQCSLKMCEVVGQLSVCLGPGTSELRMRYGLHSGPVTAGVLMGDKARFQLFGDTVNTASRIESHGMPGLIHASQSTADLLIASGKGSWVQRRNDDINVKGKGVLKTYWIRPKHSNTGSTAGSVMGASKRYPSEQSSTRASMGQLVSADRQKQLVEWMVYLLLDHVKKIVAGRNADGVSRRTGTPLAHHRDLTKTNLEEVTEVIILPKFNGTKAKAMNIDPNEVAIPSEVVEQLREHVKVIAACYRDNNPFHNFEHACHVTMSVDKFMKRIVAPDIDLHDGSVRGDHAAQLHDYTHGLTSDPMTLFAIVYSALIHDVDHRGISNAQLGKEDQAMFKLYKGKSIAEQNSLDIAWESLMFDRYADLHACLFGAQEELLRFRQLVVNVVLATDIFDKELNDLRKERWAKAFGQDGHEGGSDTEKNDLKATIVIEHIIQASDVSHTMQHWHVYRKWNERLFQEMYLAHKEGRMAANPADFWYKGELGFFDNYIIPLAKKLKDCNVFGVASDECLNYALQNRAEWEERGEDVLSEMMEAMLGTDEGLKYPPVHFYNR